MSAVGCYPDTDCEDRHPANCPPVRLPGVVDRIIQRHQRPALREYEKITTAEHLGRGHPR
jgi:hypothetical protein